MSEYTKQYFIDKFTAIPEEEIGSGGMYQHCALWHCRTTSDYIPNEESKALVKLLKTNKKISFYPDDEIVWTVNDGICNSYNQSSPKKRILAAINDCYE